jgi:hypothetical protein
MSAKHTPGPWALREDSCVIVDSVVGYPIAGTRTKRPEDENRANAHLISAAPDLLEALQEITDDYSDRFDLDSPSTNPGIKTSIARARAAIAKANGQS